MSVRRAQGARAPMLPTDYFLTLADTGSAVSRYPGERGDACLASGPEAIKAVFRHGAQFACPSHPYPSLDPFLHPLGREWLGMTSSATNAEALLNRAHVFFEGRGWFPNNEGPAASERLPAADFYFALKGMCFALGCRLLFDLEIGDKSLGLARASDVIEDIRSGHGGKASASRARSAASEFSWLALQVQRGAAADERVSHAVQETILSASVPLAYALIWTLLLLGRDEVTQDALRHERGTTDRDAQISLDALRAGSTIAVVKEALRLYPPVWAMSRTSTGEQSLAGTSIQAGDTVVVSPYALHRMRSAWNDPHQFDPQRFRTGTKPHTYLPFGAGMRTCPAAKWNLHFLVLAVQAFLARYSLGIDTMPSARPRVALRPGLDFSLTLRKRADAG
jgi:Cytochrome P450